ncbi:MAG: glycosyltransferase [Novosphingobium sp.]
MTAAGEGRRLRLLHVFDRFDADARGRRRAALINHFGPALTHAVAVGDPAVTAALDHISGPIPTLQIELPGLGGGYGPLRLQGLAKAMRGNDLILTYGAGAIGAVLAHSLFGPRLNLPQLVHHEDGDDAIGAGGSATRMLALSRAQALVVESPAMERIALERWRQPRGKVHLIPPGVDTAATIAKPRRDVLPRVIKRPGELFLGARAALGADAMTLLPLLAALPPEWHLVILGEGPGREALLAEAVRLELGDRLHLPGAIAGSARILGLFDLYAATGGEDRLALIEAMAAGLPIVGVAGEGGAATVGEANQPFLPGPDDRPASVAAAATLARDRNLRAAVAAENRTRARTLFDQRTAFERHAALYARVLRRASFP